MRASKDPFFFPTTSHSKMPSGLTFYSEGLGWEMEGNEKKENLVTTSHRFQGASYNSDITHVPKAWI